MGGTILRTAITKEGQRYVDQPIVVRPKLDYDTAVQAARQEAFLTNFTGKQGLLVGYIQPPLACFKEPIPIYINDQPEDARQRQPIVVGHEHVLLRWVKPDGNGGFVPR